MKLFVIIFALFFISLFSITVHADVTDRFGRFDPEYILEDLTLNDSSSNYGIQIKFDISPLIDLYTRAEDFQLTNSMICFEASTQTGFPDLDFRAWRVDDLVWNESSSAGYLDSQTLTNQTDGTWFLGDGTGFPLGTGNTACANITDIVNFGIQQEEVNITIRLEDVDSLLGTISSTENDSPTVTLKFGNLSDKANLWGGDMTANNVKPYLNATYNYTNITISDCRELDMEGAFYYLNESITGNADSSCFDITANNVSLDCQGNIVDGTDVGSSCGVRIYRASDTSSFVSVNNCSITDFDYGVYNSRAMYNNITNVNVTSGEYGIYLGVTNNAFVQNSYFYNNDPLDVFVSPGWDVYCNNVFENTNGTENKPIAYYNDTVTISGWQSNFSQLILCNADNSVIDGITFNRSSGSENNGVWFSFTDNAVLNNSVIGNASYGVYMRSSTNNTIENTNFTKSGWGMYLSYSDENRLNNVRVAEAPSVYTGQGVMLDNSDNNNITSLYTYHKSGRGLWLSASSGNYINNTNITYSSDDGIRLYSSSDSNVLENFIVQTSGDDGIENLGSSSNTIRYGTITDTQYGLAMDGASYMIVHNLTINGGGTRLLGLVVTNTIHSIIEDVNITGFSYGVYMWATDTNLCRNNTLRSNRIEESTYGFYFDGSENSPVNNIYNNLINVTTLIANYAWSPVWNTTNQQGDRIYSAGTHIGGNYYTNSTGNGYSDTCTDTNYDGFCDSALLISGSDYDYLPLSGDFKEPPIWSNNESSVASEYNPDSAFSYFNVSWDVSDGEVQNVTFEINLSTGTTNFTMTNDTFGGNIYNLTIILPAGTFGWRSFANSTYGVQNVSDTWVITIAKNTTNPVHVNISTDSWATNTTNSNISTRADVTVNIAGFMEYNSAGTANIYIGSSLVSNPYSNTFGGGNHSVRVNTTGNENYSANATGVLVYIQSQAIGGGGGPSGGGAPPVIIYVKQNVSGNVTYPFDAAPETISQFNIPNNIYKNLITVQNPNNIALDLELYFECLPEDNACEWIQFVVNNTYKVNTSLSVPAGTNKTPGEAVFEVEVKVPDNKTIIYQNNRINIMIASDELVRVLPYKLESPANVPVFGSLYTALVSFSATKFISFNQPLLGTDGLYGLHILILIVAIIIVIMLYFIYTRRKGTRRK